METEGSAPENTARGAVCSAHPSVPATSTCVRCGDFLCETCRTEGESVCAGCRARAFGGPFPFERSTFDLGGAVTYAWRVFEKNLVQLAGAGTAAYLVPFTAQTLLSGIATFGLGVNAQQPGGSFDGAMLAYMILSLASVVVGVVLQAVFYLGGFRVALDALEGREPSFASYFDAMKRAPAALLQMLVVGLGMMALFVPAVGVGLAVGAAFGEGPGFGAGVLTGLVLFVPMLWAWFGVLFGWLELAYDPSSTALGALGRSWEIAKGQRLSIFLMGLVLMGASIAGFMLCCLGYLPALGFTFTVHACVFLALRRGLLPNVARG